MCENSSHPAPQADGEGTDEITHQEQSSSPVRHWLPLPLAIWFWGHVRRVLIMIFGCTLLLLGLIMLVTPGPGIVTLLGGLGVLATEFAWARWMLKIGRSRWEQLIALAAKSRDRSHDGKCHHQDAATSTTAWNQSTHGESSASTQDSLTESPPS